MTYWVIKRSLLVKSHFHKVNGLLRCRACALDSDGKVNGELAQVQA